MRPSLLEFRRFLEDMNPSPEKRVQAANGDDGHGKEDYFGALGDEFGMEWGDIVKSLTKEPWVSSHFSLGSPHHEVNYKLSAWEIVPGTLSHNGADIRLKPQKGNRSYLKGNRLNKGTPDTSRYHLDRQQLIQFLTAGWTPAVQNAQQNQGGMSPGGMPGI